MVKSIGIEFHRPEIERYSYEKPQKNYSTCSRMGYALANNLVVKHNRTVDSSLFFVSLSLVLIIFSRKVMATDTLTQSEGISLRQTLVSSGQIFELGFFTPGNSTKKYIGILSKNIASHKIVWVANRENPLKASDTTARFFIGKDGNLKLVDSMRKTVWSTNVSSQIHNTTAVLSDKGNLILKDNVTGSALWESFNYPGDTSIPGITLGPKQMTGNHTLSSWITEDDPSPGIFLCEFSTETPPQVVIRTSSKPYWRSGPWDGSKFIGQHNTGVGYANGVIVMQNSQHGYTYVVYSPPSSSHVAIFQLTVNGNLIRSDWDVLTGKGGFKWQSIDVLCDVYGTCGPNGFCNRKRSNSCECLKGFVAKSTKEWAKGNWTSGCVRRTELLCVKNTSRAPRIEKEDGFLKFSTMKLPNNYKYYFLLDSSGCRNFCLSNCTCVAYAYPDGIGCLIWYGDLVDTQQFASGGADLFLRLSYSDLGEKRKSMKIIIILSGTLGVFLFCAFLYGLYRWKANHRGGKVKKRLQRKETDSDTTLLLRSQTDSSDIPMFQFKTLKVATSNFSETNKLGGGGFGPVYKGILEDGKVVAVKRLSSLSGQGAEEFENEILMISKLQHRNLVKLLGYCIKKDEKLIIYEYMKNKSLDTYLFDTKSAEQLDWAKRLNIIHGIARGLLYLHRDSCLRIIHRDLKASNILLDENMNPKISDFGLARSFQITQEQANTNHVVGTFGYISPEYAMGGLVSEKSDVYSFGVLLLEIISGMRITSIYDDGKYNLLCYAWHLWEEGKATDLIDKTLVNSCPDADFIRCMHIGLLCVQDHTTDRPTMSNVVLMLTSDTDLPQPKQPLFYKTMVRYGLNSQSSPKFYDEVDNNVDDQVEADTLLTLNGDAYVHNQYPTHRHTGSQRGEGKDVDMTRDLELKMKSI